MEAEGGELNVVFWGGRNASLRGKLLRIVPGTVALGLGGVDLHLLLLALLNLLLFFRARLTGAEDARGIIVQ